MSSDSRQNDSTRRPYGLTAAGAPALFIVARSMADSLHHGRHPSSRRGASTEFYDFRPYVPGDPVRLLDWRALARSDRAYLRRFRHEGQLTVTIVLDASASMNYASLRPSERDEISTKFRRAQELAAAIALITVRQGDRVGLIISGDGPESGRVIPHGAGQGLLRTLLAAVENSTTHAHEGGTPGKPLLDAIELADARTPRGGLVVILSDALDAPVPLLDAAARARRATGRNRDVALIQVLAPDELDISAVSIARLVDPETGQSAAMRSVQCADAYAASIRKHNESLRAGFGRLGGRFAQCITSQSPLDAIREALAR